jgi:DNA-binding response OmpR family regulator
MTAHILLVEDDVKLSRFMESELSLEGYRVSVVHDGIAGLRLAQESQPHLAILDWMLPGIDGVQLCRRLRALGNKYPIILLTARDEISDRAIGLEAGANDFVVKPFDIEALFARINIYLSKVGD